MSVRQYLARLSSTRFNAMNFLRKAGVVARPIESRFMVIVKSNVCSGMDTDSLPLFESVSDFRQSSLAYQSPIVATTKGVHMLRGNVAWPRSGALRIEPEFKLQAG